MADDATRRLLKVFGVSVTECEDALTALTGLLGDPSPGATPQAAVAAFEAYGKAARELEARWAEVGRLVLGYHARAQAAVETHLRVRAG